MRNSNIKERLMEGLKAGIQLSTYEWADQLGATEGYISVLLVEIRKEKIIFPRTVRHPETGKSVVVVMNDEHRRSPQNENNHLMMIDRSHERSAKDAFTRLSILLDEAERCIQLFPQIVELEGNRLIQIADLIINRDYEKYRQLASGGETHQLIEAGSLAAAQDA